MWLGFFWPGSNDDSKVYDFTTLNLSQIDYINFCFSNALQTTFHFSTGSFINEFNKILMS